MWRYHLRTLRRDRTFAISVILTLAIAIGANTAIFTIVESVLLRPLPYQEPDRLYAINEIVPRFADKYPTLPVNMSHYFEWRTRCASFESVALLTGETMNLTGAGAPEQLRGVRASANFLSILGIRPQIGRGFRDDEDPAGHDRVVLISHSLWMRRFAGDPAVLGRKITLDGQPYDVVGVLPAGFRPVRADLFRATEGGRNDVDVYKPLGYTSEDRKNRLGEFNHTAIARLRRGVSVERALSELNVVQADLDRGMEEQVDLRGSLTPLIDQVAGRTRDSLLLIMAAVAAVLLILCVNLANLSLARAMAKARDTAIRTALGAGRGEIVRDVIAESVLLSLTGGLVGTVLAYAGVEAFRRAAPAGLPRLDEISADWRVFLFAFAISIASGLLFGVVPAIRSWVSDPQETLKSGATTTEGAGGVRTRATLVAVQVSLSAALLIIAGLLINSFNRLMNADRGFQVERILTAEVSLPSTQYGDNDRRTSFYDRLLAATAALPGVMSVGLTSTVPLRGETWIDLVGTEHDPRPIFKRPSANVRFVNDTYFRTLGIGIRAGRPFEQADRQRKVAIINAGIASQLWPGQNAIGRKMLHNDKPVEIVGVVPDLRLTSLDTNNVAIVYVPYWQRPRTSASLLVRTAVAPSAMAATVRNAVWAIDPQVPVPEVKTLVEVMHDSVSQRRLQLQLVVAFAAAALLVASLGIYGVVAYSVERRRSEMGIRMALGATGTMLVRMVLGQGMLPVAIGLVVGIAGGVAGSRLVRSMLFGVTEYDAATYAAAVAILAAVAVSACLIPAARATRVDAVRALRYD